MTILETDVQLRYSGGPFNIEPDKSLGGLMSQITIKSGSLENLFDSVVDRDKDVPLVDYRAVYVVNSSVIDSLYHVGTLLEDVTTDGTAIMKIGTSLQNEIQTISIPKEDTVTGGSFALKFGAETTETINWSADINTMATDIQLALRGLDSLRDVSITGLSSNNNRIFTASFIGEDGNHLHPILSSFESDIKTTSGLADIIITATQRGSPINDVATDIAFANNAPVGIVFVDPMSFFAPISIGRLRPSEGFFVWIERTVAVNSSERLKDDGFTLRITGFTTR